MAAVRRGLVWLLAALLSALAVGVALGHSGGRGPVAAKRHGYDVSWPQCSGTSARRLPPPGTSFVILGLTDGAGHTVNPCLGAQVAWARVHHVAAGAYLVPSYPDRAQRAAARRTVSGPCRHTLRCVVRRDGVLQARDALATMRLSGLRAPRVWVDVEFRRYRPWSRHNRANAAVVQGVLRGLSRAHEPVGVYSTSYMWRSIVGGYRVAVPNWLPVGHGGPRRALRMCQTTASGGVTWLAQYTRRLDSDLTCPVLAGRRGHHSRLWQFRRKTLRLLSQGSAVRAVQHRLHVPATGSYGALTVISVRRWQRDHHLPVTGRVTPRDWRAMGAYRLHGGHGLQLGRFAHRW